MGAGAIRWIGVAALLAGTSGCALLAPQVDPNTAGVRAFEAGQYDWALDHFRAALKEAPNDPDVLYNLASAYHRLGDFFNAEFYYGLCLNRNPDHPKAHHAKAVLLLAQGRTNEAFALLETWAAQTPNKPEPQVELAWIERQAGETAAVRAHLERALELNPSHPAALAALADLYDSLHDHDRAIALYERSLLSDDHQPEVSSRLARLRRERADADRDTRTALNRADPPARPQIPSSPPIPAISGDSSPILAAPSELPLY